MGSVTMVTVRIYYDVIIANLLESRKKWICSWEELNSVNSRVDKIEKMLLDAIGQHCN